MYQKDGYLEEKWVRYWFRQILSGLDHMRTTNHSHLDIKCENILLDNLLNTKIADFGFAQRNDEGIRGYFGSQYHRAPEICRGQFPFNGEKADVFALAVVLFACQMKKLPVLNSDYVIDTPEY